MIEAALTLACAAALGAVLKLLRLPGPPSFILGFAVFGWLLWPEVGPIDGAAVIVLSAAAGAAALGPRGVGLGLGLSALGWSAWCWKPLLAAVGRLSFGGRFFGALLPLELLFVSVLCAAALLHSELRPYRTRLWAAVLLLWSGSPLLLDRYLRTSWDYGAGSFSEAADVPPAGASRASAVLALRGDVERGQRLHAVGRLDASEASLERARAYLESRGWRSLWKPEALLLLRRGWLDLWEADKALEASALAVSGEVVPDYVGALSLLRAGPLTDERRRVLERLEEAASTVKGGFEDVNRSKRIFEGFHAAYARFGDDERSRRWILRVEDLWPLYDNKIEIEQLNELRDGRISGRLLLDGRPASSVKVGLFLESLSETSGKRTVELSSAVYPDADGRFRFESLGSGTYFLQLMGRPEQLEGAVLGSPGLIELYEGNPAADVGDVLLERRPLITPPPGLPPALPGLRRQVR